MSPPIPANEAQRLQELYKYEILDTLPEEDFDDLTLLASQICHTPIALISLLDRDRQWFKSRIGLQAEQTGRDVSFCAHAVASDSLLVVPDATRDKRFMDNPLVQEGPHIRFYAGTPLKTPNGLNLGTLCVIDNKPRDLTDSELRALEALGRQVMSQLELRRTVKDKTEQIEERERIEKELGTSEERYRILFDSATDLIATLTPQGLFQHFNSAWVERLGYKDAELAGKPILDLLHPNSRGKFKQSCLRGDDSKECRIETVFMTKDGAPVDVEGSLNWQFRDGAAVSLQCIFRDVTERKAVEKLKEEFVSIVSHELRTPLTAILGSLGLVAGGVAGPVPAQACAMIEVAHKNSERLVHLINDILDIEKIESGKMNFDLRPIRIVPLVAECLNDNKGYAERLGVTFRLEDGLPDSGNQDWEAYVDPYRLCQVMANLLSNAAKFSPPGGEVLVKVEFLPETDRIRVSVHDNGSGIPAEFRDRIFGRFAQADSSDTRQKGGTGLGLSISKAIVEHFEGEIDFDSAPGEGTTFRFDLPRYVAAESKGTDVMEGS